MFTLISMQAWLADLLKLSQLSVNRCGKGADLGEVVTTEIHHFCDASQCAYGAVSYLWQVDSDGQVHCSFLVEADEYSKIGISSCNCVSSFKQAAEE